MAIARPSVQSGFSRVAEALSDPAREAIVSALVDGKGPVLFESLAIMEYLDEVHPHPPLLPTDPRARAFVRGIAQIVACDSHPLMVPRIRNYLTSELKLDEPAGPGGQVTNDQKRPFVPHEVECSPQ